MNNPYGRSAGPFATSINQLQGGGFGGPGTSGPGGFDPRQSFMGANQMGGFSGGGFNDRMMGISINNPGPMGNRP